MRLLHTKHLILKEFYDRNIPKYAILSHRWEDEEVDMQSFLAIRKLEDPRYKEFTEFLKLSMTLSKDSAGYRKIQKCCEKAASQGYDWVWIDTCCIDKSSSAELSEAINSMYRWYKRADTCYAYLSDVVWHPSAGEDKLSESDEEQLKASKWFTRGWTLQELIAPSQMLFLDRDWRKVSFRRNIAHLIEKITRVPARLLTSRDTLYDYSVAQKMSWAARRETSRLEDSAYCLMGLFEVNMPLLYGEGDKAFKRLQEEILRSSDDDSIFAWWNSTDANFRSNGILATSPDLFEKSGDIPPPFSGRHPPRRPYQLTNKGLEWEVSLFETKESGSLLDQTKYQVPLQCFRWDGSNRCHLSIALYALIPGPVNDYQRFNRRSLLECGPQPLQVGKFRRHMKRTVLIRLSDV